MGKFKVRPGVTNIHRNSIAICLRAIHKMSGASIIINRAASYT